MKRTSQNFTEQQITYAFSREEVLAALEEMGDFVRPHGDSDAVETTQGIADHVEVCVIYRKNAGEVHAAGSMTPVSLEQARAPFEPFPGASPPFVSANIGAPDNLKFGVASRGGLVDGRVCFLRPLPQEMPIRDALELAAIIVAMFDHEGQVQGMAEAFRST